MKHIVQDYVRELRRSPLKGGTIAVLLAVGLLLWGRLLLKEVPRTASAWRASVAVDDGAFDLGARPEKRPIELTDPGPPARDIFAIDPSHYRRTSSWRDEADREKSGRWGTENGVQAAVVSAAGKLRLTSVIEGEDPVVIINNQLLRAGDTIEGFTVVRLERRAVILESQGVKVRLSL